MGWVQPLAGTRHEQFNTSGDINLKKLLRYLLVFEKMCIHLKGECCEDFSRRPKWTRMNAQIDKRTYFGNVGLTKIEEMNPEP